MKTLHLRMRPDLILAAQGRDQDRCWVAQDPVSLKYFRLRDEEVSILRMLDGRVTLEEIRLRFERQFAPLRLSLRQLEGFLFRLHGLGLIVGDAPGQGAVLRQRSQTERRNALFARLANPLAIRLPGIAAWPIVEWLYPRCRWIFSPAFLLLCSLLVASAVGIVVVQFGAFQSRLPDFWAFFNVRTAAWFAVALVATKALHELGHGLSCRHFGGSCREFGVLLLAFMPTLYCDVSDAWRLESKWQRIAISAAGMLVELVLASVATLLWWFSEPGLLNSICLRVMFLCSVSTLLFNLNPLLRCDGYYILSDLIGVPNLWQESRGLWRRRAWTWLTGLEMRDDPTIPRRLHPLLLGYAILSTLYYWLLIIGILWFCFTILEPKGLSSLGWVLTFMVMAGVAAPPLRQARRTFSMPGVWRKVRRGRAAAALFAAAGVVACLVLVPLPHRIKAPMWIEPEDAQAVYVAVPGRLQEAAAAGTRATVGQTLAKLVSPEVELQVAALRGEVRRHEIRLDNLRLMLADDPSASALIPAEEKALEGARERLAQWRRDEERLELKSPADGTVLPPPSQAPPPADSKRLASWHGTPLDAHNRGCYLETGALLCLLGDPQRMEAMLVVEQSAVAFVRAGQRVRLRINQAPVIVMTGAISELAKADAEDLPASLANALDLPMKREGGQGAGAAETYYQARVKLDPHDAPLLAGMHGEAKVLADWQPLGVRFWRYLQRTFRF